MPRRTVYPRPFSIRLTDSMADRVEELALEAEMSATEWIRDRVRLALAADAKKRQREAAKAGR